MIYNYVLATKVLHICIEVAILNEVYVMQLTHNAMLLIRS